MRQSVLDFPPRLFCALSAEDQELLSEAGSPAMRLSAIRPEVDMDYPVVTSRLALRG